DGTSILLGTDAIRARYRKSLRDSALIDTQAPLEYGFKGFNFISRRIKRGNRLRMVVGPNKSIYSQKNYNSGGSVADESIEQGRPVTVMLFHDRTCPSALYVPLGQSDP